MSRSNLKKKFRATLKGATLWLSDDRDEYGSNDINRY